MVAADGQEVVRVPQQRGGAGLDLLDGLLDVERVSAMSPASATCCAVSGATSRAVCQGPSSREPWRTAAGPNRAPAVGSTAVERHADHGHVAVPTSYRRGSSANVGGPANRGMRVVSTGPRIGSPVWVTWRPPGQAPGPQWPRGSARPAAGRRRWRWRSPTPPRYRGSRPRTRWPAALAGLDELVSPVDQHGGADQRDDHVLERAEGGPVGGQDVQRQGESASR